MSESILGRLIFGEVRQRQAHSERIQENTTNFRNTYGAKLDDLVNQGLEGYMPNEFAGVRNQLNQLDGLISSNPERARDLSFQVGRQLSRLPGLARAARHEFQARERQHRRELSEMRRELQAQERQRRKELSEMRRQATMALNQFIHEQVSEIKDPIELDFAYDEIRAIQAEYQGRIIEADELDSLKSSIRSTFSEIRTAAQEKADTWKREQTKLTAKEANETLVNIYKEQANSEARKNPKVLNEMLSSLNAVEQLISDTADSDEIMNKIEEAATKADNDMADENCRRMVVRSIMDSLQKSGFVVSKPKRSGGDVDEVVILARKPAGAEASFRVTANGSMIYKFDHYEGMQCKEDINKVLPMLKDIYGVNFSEERVIWQNPERISKSARPLEGDITEVKNG